MFDKYQKITYNSKKKGVEYMKRNEYKVWLANMWDEDLLQEVVAIFFDLEKAIEFVEYQATLGRSYVIKHNGKKIDIE